MNPERLLGELERLRVARVPLEAVRWTHGRADGPIALVTGPGSRARADFCSGLKKTAWYVRVEFFLARLDDPTAVASEIRRARDAPDILVIAVCRGGGDEQDLSVFSHPDVVRAVAEAASIKPVVTGIGHTEDHCLADDYASVAAELPYAAGEVIHQARQAAWRRLQPDRAPATYPRPPRQRRPAYARRVPIKLIVAGAFGLLLAIASCPTDRQRPATASQDLAPASDASAPKKQVPPRKKRPARSTEQSPAARTRPPEDPPEPSPRQPATIPVRSPDDQPEAPPQQPAPIPTRPPEDESPPRRSDPQFRGRRGRRHRNVARWPVNSG